MSSLSQFYSVISPSSYISPPGGKKLMKRFAYPARHIAGGDRRQSALVIMTDLWLELITNLWRQTIQFPICTEPPLPLRLHFALSSSDRAAATDSVIRILNQAKLMRQLGTACKLSLTFPNVEFEHLPPLLLLQPASLPRWHTRSTTESSSAANI